MAAVFVGVGDGDLAGAEEAGEGYSGGVVGEVEGGDDGAAGEGAVFFEELEDAVDVGDAGSFDGLGLGEFILEGVVEGAGAEEFEASVGEGASAFAMEGDDSLGGGRIGDRVSGFGFRVVGPLTLRASPAVARRLLEVLSPGRGIRNLPLAPSSRGRRGESGEDAGGHDYVHGGGGG